MLCIKIVFLYLLTKKCWDCEIFPICHGGCSQHKLEARVAENECCKGFDAQKKLDFVVKRIQDIYNEQRIF